jgi:hypothetical protein
MSRNLTPRELAYAGLFGAAALLLPFLFRLIHLGAMFLPMYLPLLALAFFVRPMPAAITAVVVPLLSGIVTGRPPFFPPIAACMAVEIGVMAALVAAITCRWPDTNEWLVLLPVLILGRLLNVALVYGFARVIALPSAFLASLSVLSGWPGIVLILIAVPPLVRTRRRRTRPGAAADAGG